MTTSCRGARAMPSAALTARRPSASARISAARTAVPARPPRDGRCRRAAIRSAGVRRRRPAISTRGRTARGDHRGLVGPAAGTRAAIGLVAGERRDPPERQTEILGCRRGFRPAGGRPTHPGRSAPGHRWRRPSRTRPGTPARCGPGRRPGSGSAPDRPAARCVPAGRSSGRSTKRPGSSAGISDSMPSTGTPAAILPSISVSVGSPVAATDSSAPGPGRRRSAGSPGTAAPRARRPARSIAGR